MRAPGDPNGLATNRCAVRPGRFRYPRARPIPATYSSPATPTGTGRSASSSTCTRVFQMGRPIGGTPPGTSGSLQLVTTVDSVGPYELIMWRPGAHRATSSAVQASPPTMTVRNAGSPSRAACAGTVASAAGGISAWVTSHRSRTAARWSPSSGPSGGTTSAAPHGSDMHSSSTDASKLGEENCRIRSPGCTSYRSASAAEKLASPRWDTTTPLGRPVEPEV